MKAFPLFLLFSLLVIVPSLQAQEEQDETGPSSKIFSEFRAQIERYRTAVNEPPFQTMLSDPAYLKYETSLSFFRNGDGYSAIQTLENLVDSKKTPELLKKEIHATLGYIFLEQKRPKEAMEEFILIEDETDFKEKARFGIAWSFMEMEEYVKAIALFEDLTAEFPNGEYASESLFRIGFCYSKLLAFKNAAESYQKALHVYTRKIQDQKDLINSQASSIPFNFEFIFNQPDTKWAHSLLDMKRDVQGFPMMQWASLFLKMEGRLKQKDPDFKRISPENRQNLLQIRNKIHLLFQKYIQEQLHQQKKVLENLSVQTSIAMARNMVLEKSEPGKTSESP
ncbi:MAG: tetratricopeptide repeat protein [Nitrospirae bacterium]|nr:tetratricopeptide repeat protein [Nitrospirota bacterium]